MIYEDIMAEVRVYTKTNIIVITIAVTSVSLE